MFSLYKFLPYSIFKRLFGDRKAFGLIPVVTDKDWIAWQSRYVEFYLATQRGLIGKIVTSAGYKIMQDIDLNGKRVLEIGPGFISHNRYWVGKPLEYIVVDINQEMLDGSTKILQKEGIPFKAIQISSGTKVSDIIAHESVDVIVTFNCLEHLYPLDGFLADYDKVLKKNGHIVGSIPAEGGLPWGLGRFLISRRWFLKNTTINPDKIICWEHPNFAPLVLKKLSHRFTKVKFSFWPLVIPVLDLNLVFNFIFKKE